MLNGQNKIRPINKYALPVIRYPGMKRDHDQGTSPSMYYRKESHNAVAGVVYRNSCSEYELEVLSSKLTAPKVNENDRAEILWDLQIQTDKMVVANQPDTAVVKK